MPPIVIAAGIGLAGAAVQSSAARKGTKAQTRAADQQRADTLAAEERTQARFEPYQQVGQNALRRLENMSYGRPGMAGQNPNYSGLGDRPTYGTGPDYSNIMADDPGVAFRRQEGQDWVNAGVGARHGIRGGAVDSALLREGQEFGSQEYGNAYNRKTANYNDVYSQGVSEYDNAYNRTTNEFNSAYGRNNAEWNDAYGRLAAMAGNGQNAAGQMAASTANTTNSINNATANAGNAQAAGYTAQGNAVTTGLQNTLGTSAYLNQSGYTNPWLQGGGASTLPAGQSPVNSIRPMVRPF